MAPGKNGGTRLTRPSKSSTLIWAAASLLSLLYFATSLVVVVNSFVWTATLPSFWYALQRVIYWPFQPYTAFAEWVLRGPEFSYQTYALISRSPFLVVPIIVWVAAIRCSRRRRRLSTKALRSQTVGPEGLTATKETLLLGRKGQAILVIALGAVLVGLYFALPDLRASVNQMMGLVARGKVGELKEYLLAFGFWAPVVSAAIMLVHSIVPFPAVVLTLTNGLLFGAVWGTALSWSTAMVGAAICYFIAKALGRPVVERIVGTKGLKVSDDFFDRYGTHAVLITRLIPVVSFDLISYAAGLTKIGFVEFMVATGIGQLPATVVYSILGENLTGGVKFGLLAFGAVAALFVLGFAVKANLDRKLASPSLSRHPSSEGGEG